MDPFLSYRRNSRGPCSDPPAKVHPKIMFGPGFYLCDSFIEKHNITHIINCADESAVPTTVKTKFLEKYKCLNAIDSFSVNITDWYPEFEKIMNSFLRDNSSKVIYVNCQMGINRSGFLTTLYACIKFKYSYEAVTKAILLQRPCALMNPIFHQQVKAYIKKHP
jgi:hypothetical protein